MSTTVAPQLYLTLVQTRLHWQDVDANLAHLATLLAEAQPQSDLIILPEMFSTGFSTAAGFAHDASQHCEKTLHWLQNQARRYQAVITGSIIAAEDGHIYNRLVWMPPTGRPRFYDKRHLFRMGGEDQVFAAGQKHLIAELKGWRLCPLICYDLRFPVWSRNVNNGYDCLLYVANWPASRRQVWRTLLQARALENLSYVVGVNRIEEDGNGIAYSGDSLALDAKGQFLFDAAAAEVIETVSLDYAELQRFRQKFPAHLDADTFSLTS